MPGPLNVKLFMNIKLFKVSVLKNMLHERPGLAVRILIRAQILMFCSSCTS